MLFNNIIKGIKEKKLNKESGQYNCIPFSDNFPKLSKYLPGIIKGVYYLITANSGVKEKNMINNLQN